MVSKYVAFIQVQMLMPYDYWDLLIWNHESTLNASKTTCFHFQNNTTGTHQLNVSFNLYNRTCVSIQFDMYIAVKTMSSCWFKKQNISAAIVLKQPDDFLQLF